MKVTLLVENPDQPAVVRVSPEWLCWPLWTIGKYGVGDFSGSEIGLSEALVEELAAIAREMDATFNREDPRESGETAPDFKDRVFVVAQKVRDELDDEWIVVGEVPPSRQQMVLRKTGDPRPRVPYTWPLRPEAYWLP